MKKSVVLLLILTLILVGCRSMEPAPEYLENVNVFPSVSQTDSVTASSQPASPNSNRNPSSPESVSQTGLSQEASAASEEPSSEPASPVGTEAAATTAPVETDPPEVQPSTAPTQPVPSPPEPTEPTQLPPEPSTEPEPTVPPDKTITEAYRQEVAYWAAYYINRYREEAGIPACTVLPGMTKVAEYRADQLTYRYGHSTADKREALAYYQYGRWIDATLFGLDPSDSYYEADTAEAICAGFTGDDAESMGRRIAELVRSSEEHWRYVGNPGNLYIGIGVAYRAGSAYGWYGCIMVGKTNYG